MEVRVRVGGSIIVDDDIHSLNINPTSKDIRSDQDPLLKVLKLLVPRDTSKLLNQGWWAHTLTRHVPFLLTETRMHSNAREATLSQQFVEFDGTSDALDKDDDLVKVERVEKVVELAVLLRLFESDKVLLETMKSELGLVIDEDFEWLRRGHVSNHNSE
jgi:hypothetical protein